jgi:hypothetical protein
MFLQHQPSNLGFLCTNFYPMRFGSGHYAYRIAETAYSLVSCHPKELGKTPTEIMW